MKRILLTLSILPFLSLLASCAMGAATAGYSIKAQSADGLTSNAEQKIVDRIMNEVSKQKNL